MLAVVGLLYSFGVILSQRRALQGAADAAALSGTWRVVSELAADTRASATVYSAIQQYATANGAPASGVTATFVDAAGASLGPVASAGSVPQSARGVSVTVAGQVPSILPGFVGVAQTLVRSTASSIARPTTAPTSAGPVIPLAVRAADVATALANYSTFELFGANARSLNLAASGAPNCGGCSTATNMQYWSDGQHEPGWQLPQGNVNLADANYYDSIATGLSDNLRRQGGNYALVIVPVYDTATSTTAHISGFAQINLKTGAINTASPSARGVFVPYAAAAYGTVVTPSPDVGAALVSLTQ